MACLGLEGADLCSESPVEVDSLSVEYTDGVELTEDAESISGFPIEVGDPQSISLEPVEDGER